MTIEAIPSCCRATFARVRRTGRPALCACGDVCVSDDSPRVALVPPPPAMDAPAPHAQRPAVAPDRRVAPGGPLPAAPRSAFEHATLAARLGLRWRAPTDGSDRDAAFLTQTGLSVDEARRRVAALPSPSTHAPAGAPR